MINKYKYQTDYLSRIFDPRKFQIVLNNLIKSIKLFKKKNKFDCIAFRGMSGAGAAFPVAAALNIPLLMCRKDDQSHANRKVEGFIYTKKYIIIDDFIVSGETINSINKNISKLSSQSELVGIFLYNSRDREKRKFWNNVPIINIR